MANKYTYENFMHMIKNTKIDRPKILKKPDKHQSEQNLRKDFISNVDSDKLFDDFDSIVTVKFESTDSITI